MSIADRGEAAPIWGCAPHGLVSLWDMINCYISPLCALCSQLMLEQIARDDGFARPGPDEPISDAEERRISGWLQVATCAANDFELNAVHDRIAIIRRNLKTAMSQRDLATELRVLRETIDNCLRWQCIYRYPLGKSDFLKKWKDDWGPVPKSFPSAEGDIVAGVDLWALGHSTASVFHFMRVLEHGLRALANEFGRNFDVHNWQVIIDQIEAEIRALGKTLPAGIPKSERLQFLSEAAKEFVYFKDGWRNYVSHNRATYDEHQARSVLEHVRSFMTDLTARLSECA